MFGLGQVAKSPFVTAKLLQNMYAEQRPQGEKSMLVAFQTPGLDLFADVGAAVPRGSLEYEPGNVAYVVMGGTLYEVNNAGTMTVRGVLMTSSGRVSMAHNETQVMIVDGTTGYIYDTGTLAFVQITDVDFPPGSTTVTFLAGRFIISLVSSSRYYWSDLYDGLVWDALDFANTETSPDPIVMVWASNGQLILFGSISTEYHGISSTSDAPFTLIQGTATEWGLAARWSVAKYDNSVAALIRNRMGQVMVAQIAGYLPKKISTIDLDSIINEYAVVGDASSYSYMLGGHPMFVINFPNAGYTWLYDGSTGFPSKLKSFGLTRHRIEFSFSLLSKIIGCDYNTGRLYVITATALTDNGDSIEREITGETVAYPDQDMITIDNFRVDVEVGVGTTSGQGVNPQIGLSISRDNGKTWGAQMWKSMGEMGKYSTVVEWRRLGSNSRTFVPRITVTDPVPLVVVAGCINARD